MARPVELSDDAMVIRFRPTDSGAVLGKVMVEYRRTGHYGASVFASDPHPKESEESLIGRLLDVANLTGMTPDRHPKAYVCARAERLLSEGFNFLKDGDSDELPDHYCVNLGDAEPDESVVERFLSAFDRTEKRKP